MTIIFDEFRHFAKIKARENNLTYAQIASGVGLSEGMIKQFMCGDNDSRRVAERIADLLGLTLVYTQGKYSVLNYTQDKNNVKQNKSDASDST